MLRAATIQMETELSQDEFEIWLLGLIRAVATKPERSSILNNSRVNRAGWEQAKAEAILETKKIVDALRPTSPDIRFAEFVQYAIAAMEYGGKANVISR